MDHKYHNIGLRMGRGGILQRHQFNPCHTKWVDNRGFFSVGGEGYCDNPREVVHVDSRLTKTFQV